MLTQRFGTFTIPYLRNYMGEPLAQFRGHVAQVRSILSRKAYAPL